MVLLRPLARVRRLRLSRPEARPVGLATDRVASFLLHRNALRPEEVEGAAAAGAGPGRDHGGDRRQDR